MIVACGEALFDFVPARAEGGQAAYIPRPGGSPFNTAIAVGRQGVSAGFLGSVSMDFFGAQLLATLRASSVDTQYVVQLDHPSMLAFVNLESAEPQYTFYGSDAAPRFWAPSGELGLDVTVLHLAFGALLPVDQPAATNFAALFAANKGRRILTIDPNVRKNVIAGREADYRVRLAALLGIADLIKISTADLLWLAPERLPENSAKEWLADGALMVVITNGGEGATAYMRDGRAITCPAQPVKVVDTVGAGDSFMGGLLAGLDMCGITKPDQLADIETVTIGNVVAYAARVSAFTCGRAGADPPWRGDVALPTGATLERVT